MKVINKQGLKICIFHQSNFIFWNCGLFKGVSYLWNFRVLYFAGRFGNLCYKLKPPHINYVRLNSLTEQLLPDIHYTAECMSAKACLTRIRIDANSFYALKLNSISIISSIDCSEGVVTFELLTGQVFTNPSESMITIPGILHLTDCMALCQKNNTCKAVNFEPGLCVLLTRELTTEQTDPSVPSQFPDFTIYAQKICLSGNIALFLPNA